MMKSTVHLTGVCCPRSFATKSPSSSSLRPAPSVSLVSRQEIYAARANLCMSCIGDQLERLYTREAARMRARPVRIERCLVANRSDPVARIISMCATGQFERRSIFDILDGGSAGFSVSVMHAVDRGGDRATLQQMEVKPYSEQESRHSVPNGRPNHNIIFLNSFWLRNCSSPSTRASYAYCMLEPKVDLDSRSRGSFQLQYSLRSLLKRSDRFDAAAARPRKVGIEGDLSAEALRSNDN